MKMKQFPVTIYQDETGFYIVECPIIPGCMSQGRSEQEAMVNIEEAIQGCLESRFALGLPLTIQSKELLIEVSAYA